MSTRRRRETRGRRAEGLAAWWLRFKGYRVRARRYATPVGELDLVAARGSVLAFVEVKARPATADARAAVTPRQQRRIARAAGVYLQRHPGEQRANQRFDVVVLTPRGRPRHLPGAFTAPVSA